MKTLPAGWTDDHTNAARLALFIAGELGRKRLNDLVKKNKDEKLTPEMEVLVKDLLDIDGARFMLTELLGEMTPTAAVDVVQSLFDAKKKTEMAKQASEEHRLGMIDLGVREP